MSTSASIIADVRGLLAGEPVFMAGSLVAADTYGMAGNAYHDVDLFVPTAEALVSVGQLLLCNGFTFIDSRMERAWSRWRKYGTGGWHTNSLKLQDAQGFEYNVVYKTLGRNPVRSLSGVIESFDFGLLATGYDLETNQYRDMRSFLFPGHNISGALPLMPDKREAWRKGFISQYNGIREVGRYAKYHDYGYDLSLVKDDLVTGYSQAASDYVNHFDENKQLLGQIYETIAIKIDDDDIAELHTWAKKVEYTDALDAILAALE